MFPRLSSSRIVVASLLAAAGLVIVGWFDYQATRAELLNLLRGQAATLRQTVAAAARSNEAAGNLAAAQVTERLLDNVRLLAEVDRKGGLTQAFLDQTTGRNRLFRITVFAPDGSRGLTSGAGGGGLQRGRGQGQGLGMGMGMGMGPQGPGQGSGAGSGGLLQRLLSGEEKEAVGQLHSPRWGGGARVLAGIRRAGGGAILATTDASEVDALQRQVSLDTLVQDMAASTPMLAYILMERGDGRVAHGELPADLPPATAGGQAGAPLAERYVDVAGRSVLEFTGPISFGDKEAGTLRLGLRLDELRRAERRMLVRLAVSLAAALALSLLVLGTLWLRQSYRALSEKHALAEAALRRRDRLSAMGELASTVAHEVRNPLNAIAMSAQRLRLEFLSAVEPAGMPRTPAPSVPEGHEGTRADVADREELQQLLAVVEGETSRIDGIVQRFLEFARPPRLAPRSTDLAAMVREVTEASGALAGTRGVVLGVDTSAARTASVDEGQLRQVLDNLVRNAIEATGSGGEVKVTARTGPREHTIEVQDTGAGIAAEDLPRIFDLYFTTKPDGTGIGLAVSQQIVSAHGGTIEVESKPGAGTRMVVRLPANAGGTISG